MSPYRRPHHKAIGLLLQAFDADFLARNQVFFGGGTRIALELDEYRESVDIDFLCVNAASYRAIRSEITSDSLGAMVEDTSTITLAREIRADRDAIRTFLRNPLRASERPIKLEFIHFDAYDLRLDPRKLFPVACIDKESCFLTKLLANADRFSEPNKKDIIDLAMMHHAWGDIPKSVWAKADEMYGLKAVRHGIEKSFALLTEKGKASAIQRMQETLSIEPRVAEDIFLHYLPDFHKSVPRLTP